MCAQFITNFLSIYYSLMFKVFMIDRSPTKTKKHHNKMCTLGHNRVYNLLRIFQYTKTSHQNQ